MLPNLFGKTVFLLGGGPSLIPLLKELQNETYKENYYIIAINEAIYRAFDSNMLLFRDTAWYIKNKDVVDAWVGDVVTTADSRFYGPNVNVVEMKHCNDFLIGGNAIKYGRSAGHIALSLAINLRAKKCVLLGYDCRLVDGKAHFHDKPSNAIGITYSEYFLPAWVGWGDAAERAGVEVVNATPNSAIMGFDRRPLCEVL